MSVPRNRAGPIVALCVITSAGCSGGLPDRAVVSAAPAPGGVPCASAIRIGELPAWARDGFAPGISVRHVVGARGDIVAILFGYPYAAPPRPGRTSKILWAARPDARTAASPADAALRIEATLPGRSGAVVREVADGPGPSSVDLPAPGCWHLSLAWSGHTDELDIPYEAG